MRTILESLAAKFIKPSTRTNFLEKESFDRILDIYNVDDNFGVLKTYRITNESLVNLCGGIPHRGITKIEMSIESTSPHGLLIKVSSDLYEVKRRIELDDKIIFNDQFMLRKNSLRKKGIGTFAFINQIKEAQKLGFEKLSVVAQGGRHITPPDKWNGHYTWARLGYRIHPDFQQEFIDFMRQHQRGETTMAELMSSEEGKDFWLKRGFTWPGYFDLTKKSECLQNLIAYLQEKDINVKF